MSCIHKLLNKVRPYNNFYLISNEDQLKLRNRKGHKKSEKDGKDLKIRVRISLTSSTDTRLLVNTSETVLSAKKRLHAQVEW